MVSLKWSPLRKTHYRRVIESLFFRFWLKVSSRHLVVPRFELILKPGIDCLGLAQFEIPSFPPAA